MLSLVKDFRFDHKLVRLLLIGSCSWKTSQWLGLKCVLPPKIAGNRCLRRVSEPGKMPRQLWDQEMDRALKRAAKGEELLLALAR